ncbi:MAG: hypothetical protein HY712_07565 [candidate division NC10 bacterium]|nr:hypothetical protein [candidate division NC10 bacterium]
MHLVKRGIAVHVLAGVLAAAGGWSLGAAPARAGSGFPLDIRCDARNVVVRSPSRADALISCGGAQAAIGFLASQGLDGTDDIAIEVVPKLPDVVSASAAGCFMESEQRVLIRTYSEFRKLKSWFGIPIDRSLYRSLVSHEVAHSVAARNFKVPHPPIPAKEYIAYITMFSTMAPAQRERVLRRFPGEGFQGDWQMSTTIYLFDPMRFGVQAYRHFLKPANGRDYLHAILAGKAIVE